MQHLIYSGPYTAVVLDDGTTAYRGVPVEVPDDLATDLLKQAFWDEAAPPVEDDDGDDNDDDNPFRGGALNDYPTA